MYIVSAIAVVMALILDLRLRLALAVAGICGLIYLGLIVLIFLPTNRALGLDPGGADAAKLDSQLVKKLVRRWGQRSSQLRGS